MQETAWCQITVSEEHIGTFQKLENFPISHHFFNFQVSKKKPSKSNMVLRWNKENVVKTNYENFVFASSIFPKIVGCKLNFDDRVSDKYEKFGVKLNIFARIEKILQKRYRNECLS